MTPARAPLVIGSALFGAIAVGLGGAVTSVGIGVLATRVVRGHPSVVFTVVVTITTAAATVLANRGARSSRVSPARRSPGGVPAGS
jgi:hypothetical protein